MPSMIAVQAGAIGSDPLHPFNPLPIALLHALRSCMSFLFGSERHD
jgi:hypothetical protein